MSITRRLFLRSTAAASALAVPAATAPAVADPETQEQRMHRLRKELIEATKAVYPDVTDWRPLNDEDDADSNIVGLFMILGHKRRNARG